MNRNTFIVIVLSLFLISCAHETKEETNSFISTKGHQFIKNGEPYYFVGTNYWYGGILASEGIGGDRERLIKELDLMQQTGIDNLRILVGAQGPNNQPYRVTPALQMEPGVYNDTLLDGLDFLMNEMRKRDMHAILFLNNTWEWSGGYAQYVNWNGYGDIPYPQFEENSWPEFMEYASQFLICEPCKKQNQDFIKFILSRTNSYNGLKYTEDPTVMTWEIANEPRALTDDKKEVFSIWIKETADYIKSLDANHLVTTGTEGKHGCQQDIELFKEIHSFESVDYLCMHIWPKNWQWINSDSIPETIDRALVKAEDYMSEHIQIAEELKKPIVFEEFGLPRDNHLFHRQDPTTARDKFFKFAFDKVEKHAKNNGALAGTNFWAYGGYGKHLKEDPFWSVGDDVMGDPPQEEQGLNSVFDTDTTVELIKTHAENLKHPNK
jgi:mannan endo-1,4-beta-mannosidase